jgi:hypothetical protein
MATTALENLSIHSLPPFANASNRSLAEKIKNMEIKLNSLTATLEDNASRSEIMTNHMKNVKQELSHTQVSMNSFFKMRSREFTMPNAVK